MAVALPTLAAYIGFSQTANTGAWTLGTSDLGTGTVLGQALIYVYTNVAADMRSFSQQRGKTRVLDHFQAGSARFKLDNRAREYDPLNLAGTYVTGGATDVKPGRPCYIEATHPTTGVTYRLFTGRIREWDLDYTGQFDSTATVTVTDAMTELAQAPVDLTTSATDSGSAAAEVLVDAGVTSFTASEGMSSVQATTFDGTALEALRILETTEQGAVWVEPYGDVVFSSRGDLVSQPRSRFSQATFGVGDLTYTDIKIAYESDQIKNHARLTRTGGTEQTATNTTSQDAYGPRTITISNLASVSDAEVAIMASYLVGKYGEPYVRIKSITIAPQKNDALMTQALERRIRDRVTVYFTPVGGGTAIEQEVFITGIQHEITPQRGMTTTFTFEPTDWSYGWLLGTDALGSTTLGF